MLRIKGKPTKLPETFLLALTVMVSMGLSFLPILYMHEDPDAWSLDSGASFMHNNNNAMT